MSRKQFYQSKAWKLVRRTIWLKQSCLCARCKRAVYVDGISEFLPKEKRLRGIVHHKHYLNDTNYMDDNIALNEDNLEGLCIDCHNKEHEQLGCVRDGFMFDSDGNIIEKH